MRDRPAFVPADRPEQESVTPDLILVSPLVGLGRLEVNRQDHALVWPLPGAQGGPCGQGILGVDDAGAASREAAAQGAVEEHLVPVPIPDDIRGSDVPLQYEGAEGVDGVAEHPAP